MCLFNLFSKDKDEKDDLPPPRPTSLGRRTPEATSRLQGSKFDGSPRPSGDKDKYGYGVGYSSGNGSLGVGGPHGGLYGGVNGGVYSGVSGGPNGGVNGGVYGGVSGTTHGGGLAPAGGTLPSDTMEWEEFHEWILCLMGTIAGPSKESDWTLEDIYMSHGDRLRYVAMSNEEYAAFLEWRESQKGQTSFLPCSFLLEPLIATVLCCLIFSIALP
ncbi:hypothetical protein FMEXI_8199 [Fusarium mexicanum]|uniref:Uncharacterized protein n=1 Tax=Fusarium mexicanum TaxID=751941 RepID=A0A8H5IP25_9HYPO|nr:hypothetical protein FMEXI_8199 [Fusarium mexicanum]